MGFILIFVLGILIFIGVITLLVKAINDPDRNSPTWKGIIISALFGLLPLYLILCFFGLMGEERHRQNDQY